MMIKPKSLSKVYTSFLLSIKMNNLALVHEERAHSQNYWTGAGVKPRNDLV